MILNFCETKQRSMHSKALQSLCFHLMSRATNGFSCCPLAHPRKRTDRMDAEAADAADEVCDHICVISSTRVAPVASGANPCVSLMTAGTDHLLGHECQRFRAQPAAGVLVVLVGQVRRGVALLTRSAVIRRGNQIFPVCRGQTKRSPTPTCGLFLLLFDSQRLAAFGAGVHNGRGTGVYLQDCLASGPSLVFFQESLQVTFEVTTNL